MESSAGEVRAGGCVTLVCAPPAERVRCRWPAYGDLVRGSNEGQPSVRLTIRPGQVHAGLAICDIRHEFGLVTFVAQAICGAARSA